MIFMFSFPTGSRFKVQRLTCADARFNVTRAAECAACDCNGKAQQGKQGKEKEEVGGFHASKGRIVSLQSCSDA